MKEENKQLTLEEGLKREWIITNGIGGYASSTIVGVNTRKYHGLLVAPFTPPGNRTLILSKLDESLEIDGKAYNLYTNICKDYISDGYKKMVTFEKEYIPIFTYRVEDTIVKKFICMEYGKNTVIVYYYIKNQDSQTKLTLAPVVNCRNFHSVNQQENINLVQDVIENKVKLIVDNQSQHPIYMNMSEGTYIKHEGDMFHGMYYLEEEKRGQAAVENHVVPGRYEIALEPNEEKYITFVCSLEENIEEIDGKEVISKEIVRLSELTYDSGLLDEKIKESASPEYINLVKSYITAADNFVVYRSSFALYTIIAGYPWFLDWGRDSLISFEGLLLKTRRFNVAKEVLLTSIRDMKFGLVPNGYSGYDNRPLYNSVDASLLLFEQVNKFLRYTNEYGWIKENIYPALEKIIEAYTGRIDVDGNNIYMDKDYLISSGTENIQNTWMDAKIGDFAVTPRNGKAVEINSMWYNSLKIMENLCKKYGKRAKAKKYAEMASSTKTSFEDKFYNARRKCLYDVLGDSKIRPNQLFALSLTYPIIDPNSEKAENMIKTIEKKLLNPYGLKTLAKGEEGYVEIYEGDAKKRDMSYHQGITWTWLLGLYFDSLKNMQKSAKTKKKKEELESKIQDFRKNVIKTFSKEIVDRGCVGSIAEIYDSCKPYESKGTISQAWSVAEILRIVRDK